jgi:hypothetical protein
MTITARQLNRATLGRQLLLQREPLDLSEAIRRVVALQAQEPASPYLALWNRIAGFDPANLDAAFVDRTVVKAHHLRMTLHATLADDYPRFREATEPSIHAARLRDNRFVASGMTLDEADVLVLELLAFASQPRTSDEMVAWLEARHGSTPHPGVWWALRQYSPWLRAPTGEPWSFGTKTSYVSPSTLPVLANPEVAAESLKRLVLRYLAGFGPATVADIAQFAMVQRARVKAAIQSLGEQVERLEGPNGEALFDLPDAAIPDEDTPAPPRLLGMWDNVLLSYHDRSRVIPPEYRKTVIRINGDTLPTLLVDGYVAGVWRAVDGGIEARAFHPLSDDTWDALAAEARLLLTLVADRDPQVYRRYNHWWDKLPAGDTRLLRGD